MSRFNTRPTFAMATRYAHVLLQTAQLHATRMHACPLDSFKSKCVVCKSGTHAKSIAHAYAASCIATLWRRRLGPAVQFNRAKHHAGNTSTRVHTHGTQWRVAEHRCETACTTCACAAHVRALSAWPANHAGTSPHTHACMHGVHALTVRCSQCCNLPAELPKLCSEIGKGQAICVGRRCHHGANS
jgi:hypothetical protein